MILSTALERTKIVLTGLGNPQDRLRIIHVAGTNGKGSVCAMLNAVLQASGYRVGLYTSPHLRKPTERIRVNGVDIQESLYKDLLNRMKKMAGHEAHFSELYTLMAYQHFLMKT